MTSPRATRTPPIVTGWPQSWTCQRGSESCGVRYRTKVGKRRRAIAAASRVLPSTTTPRTPRARSDSADSSPKWAATSSLAWITSTESRGTSPIMPRNFRITSSRGPCFRGRPRAGNP